MQQIDKRISVRIDESSRPTAAHSLILKLQQLKQIDAADMNNKFPHLTETSLSRQPTLNELSTNHQNVIVQEYMQDANFRFFIEFSAGALGGAVSRTV
jgi:hypothetical protein